MTQQMPPGQGPIDPREAFSPPPPPVPGGPPAGHGGAPGPGGPGWGPPPPMMYPPPPPPQLVKHERSFTKAILVTFATTIFSLSLLLNLYLLLFVVMRSEQGISENTIIEGSKTEKVAVVSVSGIIDAESAQRFNRLMRKIEADADVKAIVVEVDSPGGTVSASDEIYHRIRKFKTAHGKPVVISMGSLAASGGYYIACAGDYVYAQPATLTGNIGVLMLRYNLSKLAEDIGIEETTLESTGTPFKNAGSLLKPEDPDERAYFQALIDDAFAQFKDVVQQGRGKRLTQPIAEVANGKIYTASQAKKLGLVDDTGYLDDAYTYAAQQAGLQNMTVVRFSDPPSLLQILQTKSNIGAPGSSAGGVTINGVNVNVDMATLQSLMTPQLMYLWRGQ